MKIDVSPDMPMYNLLKSYPYELSGALSEYIDNSLQAYLDASEEIRKKIGKLKVTIDISLQDKHSQFIKVKDNGVGISFSDLQRAMKPGFKPKEQSLHEFGIGMKAASVWLGRDWKLRTSPIDDKSNYQLDFDLDELIETNQTEVDVSEVPRKSGDETGVEISVYKLRDISVDEVISASTDLHDIYQMFIYRDKILELNITLDGTSDDLMQQIERKAPKPLEYPYAYITKPTWSDSTLAFKYGKSKEWKESISFNFNNLPVKGFVTVRETASQKDNPGLALFRFKRLIQGSQSKPYRPRHLLGTQNKAAPSKIYMELHLDGQPITHTKGKFNFDEHRFLNLVKELPQVKEALKQAEAHRKTYEDEGTVIECRSLDDIKEKLKILRSDKKLSEDLNPTAKGKKPIKKKDNQDVRNKKKIENKPIDILAKLAFPDSLLIEDIAKEAYHLYSLNKPWGFILCFRVILEKAIHEKLKVSHPDIYQQTKISEKGIAALLDYLNSNQQLITGNNWKSLKRSLKQLVHDDLIDIANLASHGHSKPDKDKLDTFLLNTQELLKWSISSEG